MQREHQVAGLGLVIKAENLGNSFRDIFKNSQSFIGQKAFTSPRLKFRSLLGQILGPIVGIQKGPFPTNLVRLGGFAMRTDKFGSDRFGNGSKTFFARSHACNTVGKNNTIAGIFWTDLELGFGTLATDTA